MSGTSMRWPSVLITIVVAILATSSLAFPTTSSKMISSDSPTIINSFDRAGKINGRRFLRTHTTTSEDNDNSVKNEERASWKDVAEKIRLKALEAQIPLWYNLGLKPNAVNKKILGIKDYPMVYHKNWDIAMKYKTYHTQRHIPDI
ncbi:Putative RxLR effector [Phytophthora palmivora]|uniref:RxLR effector protein n=1 Tax=Phytophthora palmivora TaxID=4796 RepID=A0A2P4XEJ6_9STRA|nr:Putative RxLR effector [Phytophthora palmivora]